MANETPLVTILNDQKQPIFSLPEPSSYSGSTSTLIDSGTSVSGRLLGAVIRPDAARVSLSWRYLKAEEWREIISHFATDERSSRFINWIEFFDQTKNEWDERQMYISDRSANMWRRSDGTLGWIDCSLELTEV